MKTFGILFFLVSPVFLFSCDVGYYSNDVLDEDDTHHGSVDDSVDDSGTDDAGTDTESETTETDNCPSDPDKTEPGRCGCGVPDDDSDEDGMPDCDDGCPFDSDKLAAGICGCGTADTDTDHDGTEDCADSCPNDPSKVVPGHCGCDNPDTDTDLDGIADCIEGCPSGLALSPAVQFTDYVLTGKVGTEYIDECPDGQVIVGFSGFLNDFGTYIVHGRIQAICGSVSVLNTGGVCTVQTSIASPLPLRGTTGSIEWERMCPRNQIIMGFHAHTGADIDELVFRCAPLSIAHDGPGHAIAIGAFTDLPMAGSEGGSAVPQAVCPDGHIATQTKLQATSILRAIGLGCRAPTLVY